VRTSLKDISLKFTLEKLRQIRRTNPDCIVVACPFCQLQFDLGQVELTDQLDEDEPPFKIPIIYITQLIGMAMGLDPEALGLIKPEHLSGISPFTPLTPILKKCYPSISIPEEVSKHD